MRYVAGLDIGGTKLSVSLAGIDGNALTLLAKMKHPTPDGWQAALEVLEQGLVELTDKEGISCGDVDGVGISCGGPLDSKSGAILSPPNLPGWENVPIAAHFARKFGVQAVLQNDADACALAEWKFGAGRGTDHMVFLTFGTGFGAGLILNGQLYSGGSNLAGEIGHCRSPIVTPGGYGPVGYGKAGSFEGFCSGGGIAELGRVVALEALQSGRSPGFCPSMEELDRLSAHHIAQAAEKGDVDAQRVYALSGRHLGACLAVLVDLLNPQRIVIGSIYARSVGLLRDAALDTLACESLARNRAACSVVPAELGDELGDVAAASIIIDHLTREGHAQWDTSQPLRFTGVRL